MEVYYAVQICKWKVWGKFRISDCIYLFLISGFLAPIRVSVFCSHLLQMIVNQFGTEAVGSTIINVAKSSLLPPEEVNVKIDRSFYLAILYEHEKSATFLPLFTGVVPTL